MVFSGMVSLSLVQTLYTTVDIGKYSCVIFTFRCCVLYVRITKKSRVLCYVHDYAYVQWRIQTRCVPAAYFRESRPPML